MWLLYFAEENGSTRSNTRPIVKKRQRNNGSINLSGLAAPDIQTRKYTKLSQAIKYLSLKCLQELGVFYYPFANKSIHKVMTTPLIRPVQ